MKKHMKTVLLLLVCSLLCVTMAACSSPAPAAEENGAASVEGRWDIESVAVDGGTAKGEDIVAEMGEMYYDFQSGGKLIAGAAGQTIEGTWKQNGAEVAMEAGGESFTGMVDGNTLTLDANGGISVFTKK
ncbi:MAG: hypothetical protein RSC25_04055 [Christensenella sp.]